MGNEDIFPRISPSCRLPQEMLDVIVDSVHDTGTLKALALASSLFVRRTRQTLFRRVHLKVHHPSCTEKNNGMLQGFEWNSCVKVLELQGNGYYLSDIPTHPFHLVKDIISHFPAVEKVILFDFPALDRAWSETEEASSCLSFPTVRTLRIYTVCSTRFSSIARIIGSFPSLTELSLFRVEWMEDDSDTADFRDFVERSPQLPLKTLDFQDCCTSLTAFNNFLFPAGRAVQLRNVGIRLCDASSFVWDWAPILQRAGQNLQEVCFEHRGFSVPEPLVLQFNDRLESLTIESPLLERDCRWITQTIQSIQSPNIRSVKLSRVEAKTLDRLNLLNLEEIDRILSEKTPSKSLVHFDFHMVINNAVGHSDEDQERRAQATAIVHSRLPRLSKRGILSVECAKAPEREELNGQ